MPLDFLATSIKADRCNIWAMLTIFIPCARICIPVESHKVANSTSPFFSRSDGGLSGPPAGSRFLVRLYELALERACRGGHAARGLQNQRLKPADLVPTLPSLSTPREER